MNWIPNDNAFKFPTYYDFQCEPTLEKECSQHNNIVYFAIGCLLGVTKPFVLQQREVSEWEDTDLAGVFSVNSASFTISYPFIIIHPPY